MFSDKLMTIMLINLDNAELLHHYYITDFSIFFPTVILMSRCDIGYSKAVSDGYNINQLLLPGLLECDDHKRVE